MTLDVLGLLAACSYALDCVEAELVHVTNNYSKRVAYMSVCIAKQMGIQEESLQDLAVCALLHDNALTQYIQEELHNDISQIAVTQEVPKLGAHCIWGEKNVAELPFHTDVSDVILYHHENADGSGPFGKKWDEIPLFSRIIHLCDLLDIACRTKKFAEGTWKVAEQFVQNSTGTMFDRECRDAFLRAFSEEQFLSLDRETFEDQLWKMVPRIKQDLDFSQIKALAVFFARIVDYKSPFTSTHSIGVAEDAEKLSRHMGFDEETVQKMYLAGALHDIGKVAIGNEILEKPGKLTDEEMNVVKQHPLVGAAMTQRFPEGIITEKLNKYSYEICRHHHERYDGSGYPDGLKGNAIPMCAQVVGIVDAYDALINDRPYKRKYEPEEAIRMISNGECGAFSKKLIQCLTAAAKQPEWLKVTKSQA